MNVDGKERIEKGVDTESAFTWIFERRVDRLMNEYLVSAFLPTVFSGCVGVW